MSSSPIHEGIGTVRTRSGEELAEALEVALRLVEARGTRISPQSRLRAYLPLLLSRGTEMIERVSHAHHEADEIVTAVEQLARPPEVAGWNQMFRDIQCGPTIAPLHHDKAREKQTELLMGALMRSTGAVVTFGDPDAKAVVKGHALSFAAKRPSSASNLQKNVRDGRNQLSKAGGVGVLFMDITSLVPELARAHTSPSVEHAVQAFDRILDSTIQRVVGPVVRWMGAEPGRARSVAAIVSLLSLRFVVPSIGTERTHFGTLRRIHANAVTSSLVPKWLFDFILRFNRVGVDPEAADL